MKWKTFLQIVLLLLIAGGIFYVVGDSLVVRCKEPKEIGRYQIKKMKYSWVSHVTGTLGEDEEIFKIDTTTGDLWGLNVWIQKRKGSERPFIYWHWDKKRDRPTLKDLAD